MPILVLVSYFKQFYPLSSGLERLLCPPLEQVIPRFGGAAKLTHLSVCNKIEFSQEGFKMSRSFAK